MLLTAQKVFSLKYLAATAPTGMVMFISEAYGGKCSDGFITQNSGFLDHLRAGDEVMASQLGTCSRKGTYAWSYQNLHASNAS